MTHGRHHEEGNPGPARPESPSYPARRAWAQGTTARVTGLAACAFALIGFLALLYHAGSHSYVRINDNLDGIVPLYKVLSAEPLLGGLGDRVEAPIGGVPRNSLRSVLNLGVLPYLAMDPLWALLWNELVARLVGFTGMFLLLRRRWLRDGTDLAVLGGSLAFALLPIYAIGHLSVAAQPWLLHALLSIRERRARAIDWIVLILFPLYTSLVYIGVYVVALVGLLALWEWVRSRRFPAGLAVAVGLMALLYACSEYRLLYQTFFEDYVSFRTEWDHRRRPLLTTLLNAAEVYLFSQHHAAARQFPLIHLGAVLALGLGVLGAWRRAALRHLLMEPLRREGWVHPSREFGIALALGGAALIALVGSFYTWELIQDWILSSGVAVLRMFGLHRFQWFHPLLFGLVFAWSLDVIGRRGRLGWAGAALLLASQLGWLVWSSDPLHERRTSGITYAGFYSPELFGEIRSYIDKPADSYRVASFALIPGIPLYNGFQTVDGFQSNYPLEYKHRFRSVIAPELAKDDFLRDLYDNWGAHVHLYSSELGMIVGYRKRAYYTRDHPVRAVEELSFDPAALWDLGTRYLLSAVEIRNHETLGLAFERTFERDDSPWEIYLYSLANPGGLRDAS